MITTVWAIWKARRDIIQEDVYQSPFHTCKFITHFLHVLGWIDSAEGAGRWIPPPQGVVKGNLMLHCHMRTTYARLELFFALVLVPT